MTDHEIELTINEINAVKKEASKYYNYEQAVKLCLNSIYGAFGNPYFFFFNVDIAETITLQGKDAILYTEDLINKYFREYWHKDVEVHKEMGITVTGKIEKPVGIYIDTDSVVGNTIIHTDQGSMTIAELYQYSLDKNLGNAGNTLNGHESVNTIFKTLNWSELKGLYHAPIKRVIRHKVSKKKWKLRLKSGKEVIVTNDHSLIVFRNGKKLEVKPSEILKTDKVLSVYLIKKYQFEDIESIECIGEFDNEYVYDLEVDDDTHTFIANDILVHNSIYVKFDEVIKKSNWAGDEKEFILKLYKTRLGDYIEKILQKYANDNNAENFLSFELESIAKNAIWLAKKKYMQNIVWKDPDIHYNDLTKISAKGFEIIQSSTPIFAREKLKELLIYIFSVNKLNMKDFANRLKEIRRQFKLANIDQISFSKKVNNYQNYILNDYDQFEIGHKCPIGVRAAGYHNYLLHNSGLKGKYQPLGNGEKLKMYFSTDKACDVFAYTPGDYPYEFAPHVDYDIQFEKTILDPINRVVTAMGFKGFNRNLIYTTSVF